MRYCTHMKPDAVVAPLKLSIIAVMLATSLMLPSAASAQRGSGARPGTLPSQPNRPVRPPTARPLPQPPSPQQPRSPFAAGPRTYAPRYDVPVNGGGRGYGRPFYGGGIGGGTYVELPTNGAAAVDDSNAQPVDVQSPRVVQIGPSSRPVSITSRGPDTFYVIAGCYAGNQQPDPQRLPKGCDAAKLRTTPVR
jgi:hypothetical protein